MLERLTSEKSCFVTLTYDDYNLPGSTILGYCSLYKKDLQDFWKRMRKRYDKIRYFAVGEYGEESERPHYHAAIFGVGMEDASVINDVWGLGFTFTGDLTKDSASYMTEYIIKGWNGNEKRKCLLALQGRVPEFATMSRRPGIGANYVDKMAEHMQKKNYIEKERVRKEVVIGKKKYPLGKYLTSRLMYDMVGEKAEERLSLSNFEFQNELFDKHLGKDGIYVENISKEDEAKRNSQDKRRKIFKKRRVL